jgi:hypothetical protein
MSIKNRLRRLQIAGKEWIRQKQQERAAEADRLAFRQRCIAAGVRPPDHNGNLAPGEWDKYCQFYGIDYDRDSHDMPCDSWRLKSPVDHMPQIWYWYSEMNRGAMTREEYHRRVLELAGLPPPENAPSSGS